jgi:hypothetical protein
MLTRGSHPAARAAARGPRVRACGMPRPGPAMKEFHENSEFQNENVA